MHALQIYRVLGTVVHLAMSADSSCRGLRSATNGPVVMELTQGIRVDAILLPRTSTEQ